MVIWLKNGVEKSWSCISVCSHCISQKRVLSGFVVLVLLLTVFLFNVSFKTPFLNPIFQGFNSLSSNSSYFSNATDTNLTSSFDFMQNGETPQPNVSDVKNGTFVSDSRNGGDFEDALLRNSSDLGENVSDSRNGGDFEDTLLGNSSYFVKNESFVANRNVIVEESIEGKFEEGKGNGSFVGESVGSGDDSSFGNGTSFSSSGDKIDNLLDNGENGALLPSPEVKIPVVSAEKVTAITKQSQIAEMQKTSLEKCDIFDGRWVRDDTKPYYPAGSCPHIDTVFDCYLNKRPDSGFVKWRWQPNGCDIPSLNATDFLERLRGKKMVFVGDSLNRNMWESLVCMLRHSVKDKTRIHEKRVREISGEKDLKNQGFHAFRFEDYDCSVDFVTSRFLVRESSFEGKNGSLETLSLDLMDQSTSIYSNADYLIFNTGHWWSHDKTSKRQNYYHEGNIVHTNLKVYDAYRKALKTWARWVDKNIDRKKTQVIFRGYSATHFRRSVSSRN
ncbi:protein trichome birefringence-like isoform X2 [Apium graveolens]|uniref:protein trichome birefringence-like isoform X2 n=1 Tax=Apium graveolens TaxID=4045 RepID=UPI003D7A3604